MADTDRVPERFEIDLGEAKIGDGLRWSAVKENYGARPVIAGRDFMIASVAAPTTEAEAAPAAAAPAPAPDAKGKGKAAAPAKGGAAPAAAAKPAAPAKKK